jgi:hypothetical protein
VIIAGTKEQSMAHQLEALYVAQFGDVALGGHYRPGGVILLSAGHIFGGSSGYYYVGNYSVDGRTLRMSAKIVKHDPTAEDAFGDRAASFNVDAQLTIGDDIIEGEMERIDRPGTRLPLRMIWKENLL